MQVPLSEEMKKESELQVIEIKLETLLCLAAFFTRE